VQSAVFAFVVVVVNGQGNGFVQLFGTFNLAEWWQFILERAKEPLHVAILPGTSFGAGAERYFQTLAELLVFVA